MEERKEFVEKTAWKIFQQKIGMRFKKTISDEDKKTITDVDSYEYYRTVAAKIYEKRLKAVNNKKYKVIEVSADGTSGMYGGAYTLCFVYSKYNGNFVLKGYLREVEKYLKENYTHYFYNLSLWNQGINRDIWYFWKKEIGIFHPAYNDKRKGKKILIRKYSYLFNVDEVDLKIELAFKRLPKRWIPEFDKF